MSIDILAAFEHEPPALDFIWPGFLAGTVGALIAPGATGKSFWALEAAMAVAGHGASADLLGLQPARHGKVFYLAGEDPAPALIRRLHSIGQYLPDEARVAIAQNLVLEGIMGTAFDVIKDENKFQGLVKQAEGTRLLIIDTLSRIHTLDENSNSDMSRLVSRLEQLAACTGAAVLFLHHASKGSARDGQLDHQQAARGASALIDNARWCGYVARMTDEEAKRLTDRTSDRTSIGSDRRSYFVRYGVSKQNYDAMQSDLWFERQEGGVLLSRSLFDATKDSGKTQAGRRSADGF